MNYLSDIKSPDDLRKYSSEELKKIAEEIRERIIEVVSRNGGHLASSLGAVEIIVALHKVYSMPEDKIIYDVGHQSYAHKILTGRNEEFDGIRKTGGLCGFPSCGESEYDCFGTGHSGTSVSAALGYALAAGPGGGNSIALIGDGAMTSGMVFEAMNHAGYLQAPVKVILNDNEMSISENVGSFSSYLGKLRTAPGYMKHKEEIQQMVKNIPVVGAGVYQAAHKIKGGVKSFFVPGLFFEELGFKYYGPVDGHDIDALTDIFSKTKDIRTPVLIHVVTKKGKGFQPAEEKPVKYHGVSPVRRFDVESGMKYTGLLENKNGGKKSYTDYFGETVLKLGLSDERITAITAAMKTGTGLSAFAERFPDRFYDAGIAEQHAVTMAAAMALAGKKPYVAIYSTFLQRAYDQIIHDVALQNAPVVFAVDRAGLVGEDGATHHGVFDISFLRCVPNMVLMAPKDEQELADMLYTASKLSVPVAVRYPRGKTETRELREEFREIPLGRGEILREGKDLTVICLGHMNAKIPKLAFLLEKNGIDAEFINPRFIKPLDRGLITGSIRKTGCAAVLEEGQKAGGFAGAVMEMLNDSGENYPVLSIGIDDGFVSHGSKNEQEKAVGLNEEEIAEKIFHRFFPEGRERKRQDV